MKIAILSPYLPYPPHFGGASRIYNLIKHLSKEHSITLLSLYALDPKEENVEEMLKYCERVIGVSNTKAMLSGGSLEKRFLQLVSTLSFGSYQKRSFFFENMQNEISQTLRRESFDIVQVEFSQMAYYDLPTDAKLVLDQHNIEHDILKRTFLGEKDPSRKLFNLLEYFKFRRDEIELSKKFDFCVTTSDRDARVLNELLPSKPVSVAPNGVDTEYFSPTGGDEDPMTLVFTGTIQYYPNTDGILYFLQKVFPLVKARIPSVKLLVVGSNPPEEILRQASADVIVTGSVPDVRPYLQRATAAIVPLRIGGGTRLKVLEALAMQKAVVSTAVGCEGIDVTNGENILIGDDPAEFAECTVRLLEQAELRKKIAAAGRELVEQKYDWVRSAEVLNDVYSRLVESNTASVLAPRHQTEISR